jgi:hypothetical protein
MTALIPDKCIPEMDSKTEMARESVITVLTASAIEEPEL